MKNDPTPASSLDEILGVLAEDLTNYDKRMTSAGAPPIRFVHKYVKKAKQQIEALITDAYKRGAAGVTQLECGNCGAVNEYCNVCGITELKGKTNDL